jgi:hypothetical protein
VAAAVSCTARMCSVQVDAVGVSIKELQTQAGSFQKDVGKVKGNIAAADTQLETIRSSRAALLESATLEQVGGGRGTGAQLCSCRSMLTGLQDYVGKGWLKCQDTHESVGIGAASQRCMSGRVAQPLGKESW